MDWIRPYAGAVCDELNAADPDRLAFLRRLQAYVHRNVQPRLDKEPDEDVFCPETTIKNGYGDCKKMTVIIGSVLRRANIPFFLKHVYYADKNFTHIYTIVPYPCAKGYITLDAMENDQFDNEVEHARSYVYDLNGNKMDLYTGNRYSGPNPASGKYSFADAASMGAGNILRDLQMINGCNTCGANDAAIIDDIFATEPTTLSGIGRKTKEQRKENRQKLKDKFKNVGLAIPRGAFLTLVSINFLKLAKRMLKAWSQDKAGMENMWKGLGGDTLKLKSAIEHGAKTQVSGIGLAALASAAALAATATPILIKVADYLKSKNISEGAEDDKTFDQGIEDAEDHAGNPGFNPSSMQNQTAIPGGYMDKPETPTTPPGTPPQAGSFGPIEVNSWFDVFAVTVKSGVYSMALQMSFGTIVAGTITAVGSLYVCRKFISSKIKTAFSLSNS